MKYDELQGPALREKCPNEVFLVRIFLYSVQIQKNTDQENSVFGCFLGSVDTTKFVDFPVSLFIFNFFNF